MARQRYAVFSEGVIGRLKLKNRLVRAATYEAAMTKDGRITQKMLDLYQALTQGGVGTIITGQMAVALAGKGMPKQACVYDDRFIPEISQIAATVHQSGDGCKVIAQLNHAGRQVTHENTWAEAVAPSVVASPVTRKQARRLSVEEIRSIVEAFAQAIVRVQQAGFDGVQLHAGHGWLLSSFLSPYTNRRDDEYGGTAANRVRIIAEIVAQARALVGDFPILIKINCEDHVVGGTNRESFPEMASLIAATGVDAIEVSGGMWDCLVRPERELGFVSVPIPEARTNIVKPEKQSYFLKYVEDLNLNIPVILVGGNRNIERLEQIVSGGAAAFIALARPLVNEPDLPRRWLEGSGSSNARCISCNACLLSIKYGSLHCILNQSKPLQKIVHTAAPLTWQLFLR